MKIQYTFTANLSEVHEVLFDKLKRVDTKTSIAEGLAHLKTSLIGKKDLASIEKKMQTVLEDVETLHYELHECLTTVKGIQASLGGAPPAPSEVPMPQEESAPQHSSADLNDSLQKLTNFATSLKNIE
jgi:hypothetical protein